MSWIIGRKIIALFCVVLVAFITYEAFSNFERTEGAPLQPAEKEVRKEITEDVSPAQGMKQVIIKPGQRKEEIAALLASSLGWTSKQKTDWITVITAAEPDYVEGVYTPGTYLIPAGESPDDVAARLISQFDKNFAFFLPQFAAKNIKWKDGLTLASIIQREASDIADMPLIAGILWNRLNQGMMLEADVTLQYARGNKGAGWWAPISLADKRKDSLYNTYEHAGLPPHPISNPHMSAIDAVLHPAVTDCLYFIHDKNKITHCAKTYAEHLKNIKLYLKS